MDKKMNKHTMSEVFDLLESLKKTISLNPIKYLPSKNEVEKVENALGVKLPPSFIEFWMKTKWNYISKMGMEFCSISTESNNNQTSIIEYNNELRSKEEYLYPLPHFLIAFNISAAIDEDYSCFDTRFQDVNGEYPIVYYATDDLSYIAEYDKETNALIEIDDLICIAPDFSTFLYNCILNFMEREEKIKARELVTIQQKKRG